MEPRLISVIKNLKHTTTPAEATTLIKYYIEADKNVDATDADGMTALMYAQSWDQAKAFNRPDVLYQYDELYTAVTRVLLDCGSDPFKESKQGMTAVDRSSSLDSLNDFATYVLIIWIANINITLNLRYFLSFFIILFVMHSGRLQKDFWQDLIG